MMNKKPTKNPIKKPKVYALKPGTRPIPIKKPRVYAPKPGTRPIFASYLRKKPGAK